MFEQVLREAKECGWVNKRVGLLPITESAWKYLWNYRPTWWGLVGLFAYQGALITLWLPMALISVSSIPGSIWLTGNIRDGCCHFSKQNKCDPSFVLSSNAIRMEVQVFTIHQSFQWLPAANVLKVGCLSHNFFFFFSFNQGIWLGLYIFLDTCIIMAFLLKMYISPFYVPNGIYFRVTLFCKPQSPFDFSIHDGAMVLKVFIIYSFSQLIGNGHLKQ